MQIIPQRALELQGHNRINVNTNFFRSKSIHKGHWSSNTISVSFSIQIYRRAFQKGLELRIHLCINFYTHTGANQSRKRLWSSNTIFVSISIQVHGLIRPETAGAGWLALAGADWRRLPGARSLALAGWRWLAGAGWLANAGWLALASWRWLAGAGCLALAGRRWVAGAGRRALTGWRWLPGAGWMERASPSKMFDVWSTFGRRLVWSTVGRRLVDSRSTFGRHLVDVWSEPTVCTTCSAED